MRLLLACIVLFLAPAGALLLTDRYVSALEADFQEDAARQVNRLNSLIELYPPKVLKLRSAPAILQLRGLSDGEQVAERVCGLRDSPYQRLFERLTLRCDQWSLFRRARRSALIAVLASVGAFALILMARITVQRYARLREWPGNWTLWFTMKGLPLLLLGQVAVSLIGYGIILQTVTGKTAYALAILAVPFALLYWIERRLVLAFVEPASLRVYRPRNVKGPRPQDRLATT
jgi:hypothetical protein